MRSLLLIGATLASLLWICDAFSRRHRLNGPSKGDGVGKILCLVPVLALSVACQAFAADESWECNTGAPDAAYERLSLTDLAYSGGVVRGHYQIIGYSAFDANGATGMGAPFAQEEGAVTIDGDVYTFTLAAQNCDGCTGSLLLSQSFRKTTDEEGRPVLNEILSVEREALFNDENFDGMTQACGPIGYILDNFK